MCSRGICRTRESGERGAPRARGRLWSTRGRAERSDLSAHCAGSRKSPARNPIASCRPQRSRLRERAKPRAATASFSVSRARFVRRVHAVDARDAPSLFGVPRRPSFRVDALPVAIGRAGLGTSRASLFLNRASPSRGDPPPAERTRPIAMATSSGVANGAAETRDELGLAPRSSPRRSSTGAPPRTSTRARGRRTWRFTPPGPTASRRTPRRWCSRWTTTWRTGGTACSTPRTCTLDTCTCWTDTSLDSSRACARRTSRPKDERFNDADRNVVKSLILRVARRRRFARGPNPLLRQRVCAGPGGFAKRRPSCECVKSVFYCVAVKKRCQEENSPRRRTARRS